MSRNLASRIARLESLQPRRGEFDNLTDEQLRAFMIAEVADFGGIEAVVAGLNAMGETVSASEILDLLRLVPPGGETIQ